MLSKIGFAIEMEVVANGEPFSIRGDQERIVVSFPSIRTARRLLPLIRNNSFKKAFPDEGVSLETVIETRVSGRTIALSGHRIKSSTFAGILGLPKTRFLFMNLLRTLFSSS